jgi:hypothetical protein
VPSSPPPLPVTTSFTRSIQPLVDVLYADITGGTARRRMTEQPNIALSESPALYPGAWAERIAYRFISNNYTFEANPSDAISGYAPLSFTADNKFDFSPFLGTFDYSWTVPSGQYESNRFFDNMWSITINSDAANCELDLLQNYYKRDFWTTRPVTVAQGTLGAIAAQTPDTPTVFDIFRTGLNYGADGNTARDLLIEHIFEGAKDEVLAGIPTGVVDPNETFCSLLVNVPTMFGIERPGASYNYLTSHIRGIGVVLKVAAA